MVELDFLSMGVLLTAPFEIFKSSREPNQRLLLLLSPIEVKQYKNFLEPSCETKDKVPRPSPTISATLFIPMTWLFTPHPKPILGTETCSSKVRVPLIKTLLMTTRPHKHSNIRNTHYHTLNFSKPYTTY